MNETQTQNNQGFQMYQKGLNDFSSLKIRLDTQPILDQIELFLRGCRLVIEQDDNGKITTNKVSIGVAKCNDSGVQSLLNWISATVNPQTVQGNFPVDKHGFSDAYDGYIEEYQIELSSYIVMNCYNFAIIDSEIDSIISNIMLLVIPFFSRLIDNKERDSYKETMKTVESNVMRSKGIPLLGSNA